MLSWTCLGVEFEIYGYCLWFLKVQESYAQPLSETSCYQLNERIQEMNQDGEYSKALELIDEAIKKCDMAELNETKSTVLKALYERTQKHFSNDDYEKALNEIEIIERHSKPPELELTKGIIYFYKGELDKAGEILKSNKYNNNPDVQAIVGFLYFEKGETNKAYNAWENAISVDSKNELASLGMSIIEFEQKAVGWEKKFAKHIYVVEKLPEYTKEGYTGRTLALMSSKHEAPKTAESRLNVFFASRRNVGTKRPILNVRLILKCPNGVKNIRLLDRYQGKDRELADYQTGKVNNQIYLACKGKMLNSLNDFNIPDIDRFPMDISYTFMDVDIQHELVVEVTSKAGETASDSIQVLRKKPEVYLITYGNNNFDHFKKLKFAEKDIRDFANAFGNSVNHFQIANHTYGGLIDQIKNRREDGDIIVAAVSSHGSLFEDLPYIAVAQSNTKAENTSEMEKMAIPLQKFLDDMLTLPAQKAINPTLIIIDACHSGGGFGVFGTSSNRLKRKIQQTIAGTHAAVFLSASSLEVSPDGFWSDGGKIENGILFFHVIEGLIKGDKDQDGLTFKELNQFLAERKNDDPKFDPVVQVNPDVEPYHLIFKVQK